MTQAAYTGERPWHHLYAPGVDPHFVPPVTTWTEMMTRAFETHHDRIFIEYYGESITFGEMRARTAQAAAALRAFGIETGDRIALHLPNCPWHPVFFFAAMSVGATVTHLSPLDAPGEIAHKIADSGARLAIGLSTPELLQSFLPLLENASVPPLVLCPDPVSARGRDCPIPEGAIALESFWASHEGAPYAPAQVRPEDIALLQYTGGTTGVPKAAILTQARLAAAVHIFHEGLKTEPMSGPGMASLVYSPLFHIMGLVVGLLKRCHEGGTLHIRLRYDPEEAVREIEEKKIKGFGGVPTLWIALLRVPDIEKRDLSSLVYGGSGGAPLPVETYNRVKQLTGLKLRGGWGMTETGAAGTFVPPGMPDGKLGTIGIPYPGIDVAIADTEDPARLLPAGETGEILIRGPNVLDAYWNKPEETADAFHDGWLKTGDIGYMDEDGFFYLVDRKKDMILSGGFNVYPLVIENAVHQHPDVSQAIAIGIPDAYRGESAKVFVTLNRGAAPFTLDALQAFLADKLGRHEIPRALEIRDSLPMTPVGKPDRKVLKAEEASRRAS
jgi:long-chain acyl-CoA synthetase